jgi:hypothetical protein
MIKVMSFFSLPIVEQRIGKVYSLALSFPRREGPVAGTVRCLCPTWDMVRAYKRREISEQQYTVQYRRLIIERWSEVEKWLASLSPRDEIYLCCWEKTGFCHRYLVAKLIRKFRSDLEVKVS